jgi:HEAT repeat protein
VVTGPNDVEAAELLGALARDPDRAAPILSALTAELDSPTADSAVRIRLVQALAELPGTVALDTLRRLTHDDVRPVALLAASLVTALGDRTDPGSGSG